MELSRKGKIAINLKHVKVDCIIPEKGPSLKYSLNLKYSTSRLPFDQTHLDLTAQFEFPILLIIVSVGWNFLEKEKLQI